MSNYILGKLKPGISNRLMNNRAFGNESSKMNWMNSGKPKSLDMAILSQAKSQLLEGATTTGGVKVLLMTRLASNA